MEQNITYEFICPYCKTKYKVEGMPSIEIMKKIGHNISCGKCGKRISMIDNYGASFTKPVS